MILVVTYNLYIGKKIHIYCVKYWSTYVIYLTPFFSPFPFRFHESPSGENTLLKTGRNATEPYFHTIDSALDIHQGRYYCRIENVMGINECSAFLIIRNSASKTISALGLLPLALALNVLAASFVMWWYSIYEPPWWYMKIYIKYIVDLQLVLGLFDPWAEIHSILWGDISYMKKLCIDTSQSQLRCPSQQFLP